MGMLTEGMDGADWDMEMLTEGMGGAVLGHGNVNRGHERGGSVKAKCDRIVQVMMSMRCRALGEERWLILPESSTSVGWRRRLHLLDPIVTFVIWVISSMIPLNQNRFYKPIGNKVLKETYSANKYWPPSTWVYVNKLSITWSKRFTAVSILRRETSAATRSYRLSACMDSVAQAPTGSNP